MESQQVSELHPHDPSFSMCDRPGKFTTRQMVWPKARTSFVDVREAALWGGLTTVKCYVFISFIDAINTAFLNCAEDKLQNVATYISLWPVLMASSCSCLLIHQVYGVCTECLACDTQPASGHINTILWCKN